MARVLYVITHSTDDPDRAATALRTAHAAQAAGHEVALWLSGEGIRLGIKAVAETFREPGTPTAAEAVEALAAGGAVMHLERGSFEQREFQPESLRAGAEVAEPARLAELLADGWAAAAL